MTDCNCKICSQHELEHEISELQRKHNIWGVHEDHIRGDSPEANQVRALYRKRSQKQYIYFCNGENEKCNAIAHYNNKCGLKEK